MSDHDDEQGHAAGGVPPHACGGPDAAAPPHGGDDGPGDGDAVDLYPLPTALESLSPTQVATMVYGHVKELYALAYDKDAHKCHKTPDELLDKSATLFLMCFDDRRLSMAMSTAAQRSELFDTFAAVRTNAIDAQA